MSYMSAYSSTWVHEPGLLGSPSLLVLYASTCRRAGLSLSSTLVANDHAAADVAETDAALLPSLMIGRWRPEPGNFVLKPQLLLLLQVIDEGDDAADTGDRQPDADKDLDRAKSAGGSTRRLRRSRVPAYEVVPRH